MRLRPWPRLVAVVLLPSLAACAGPVREGSVAASPFTDQHGATLAARRQECLDRARALARTGAALPKPDASTYWLSTQTLGTPSMDSVGLYGIESAYRDMVYRKCMAEAGAAPPTR